MAKPAGVQHAITLAAPAKINLYLEVLGRRSDGFHEIETVFQTLELADTITVAQTGAGIVLACSDPSLPCDAGNLAFRAAAAYLERRPVLGGFRVEVLKRIPHGAGLGGGSSDAAAVLRACAALDPEPLSPTDLATLALGLGSDVPVFLVGGTAHGTGRGEVLTPMADAPARTVTVLMPEASLPTPSVFKALTEVERGPRKPLGADRIAAAIADGVLHNRLTAPACRLCPAVADLLAWLARLGVPHLMSGSGSACFALGPVPQPPPGIRPFATRSRSRSQLNAMIG